MGRHLFDYSQLYDPAAPVVTITIRTDFGVNEPLSAFIDSGADATIMPLSILKQAGARRKDTHRLRGTTGSVDFVGIYRIRLQIGDDALYGIEAVGYGDEIILGRDALNQMAMLLDGPAESIEITI